MDLQICSSCQTPNAPDAYFCFHCGKKLKEQLISTSILKQVLVYSVSFFLPPVGLGWAFKYISQKNEKARIIGWVIILLTIISIALTLWIAIGFLRYYSDLLNGAATGNVNALQNNPMLQQLKGLQ